MLEIIGFACWLSMALIGGVAILSNDFETRVMGSIALAFFVLLGIIQHENEKKK